MILANHYAVVFKADLWGGMDQKHHKEILTENAWIHLQELAKEGHFIIIEAWNITTGKCVSN